MTLEQILVEATARLEKAGVYSPRADAELIAAYVLHQPREALMRQPKRELGEAARQAFRDVLARREAREPLARIFGFIEFYRLIIEVAPGVFEPVIESESLVEHALIFLEKREGPLRVLDLGAGTGCLLLALLSVLPRATGLGIDINPDAVALAKRNAARAGLQDRAEFRVNDWTNGLEGPFDLVIGNIPYIPSRRVVRLVPEVRLYDPRESLDGGANGQNFYRRIARDFHKLAAPGGMGIFQAVQSFAARTLRTFRSYGLEAALKRNHFGMPVGVAIFRGREPPKGFLGKILYQARLLLMKLFLL